jgi:hypothetical protein
MLTLTRDTVDGGAEGESAAVVAAFLGEATRVSGAPTHTGRLPARPDPADGPAFRRLARGAPAAVMTAVALPADGHVVCGLVHGRMAGTRTFRPVTGWTATGLPADAAGARPQPPNTPPA